MRIKRLQSALNKKGMLPYLVSDLCNIRYLTGFTGSFARMLIGRDRTCFISDSRYEEYACSILPGHVEFVLQEDEPFVLVRDIVRSMGSGSLYLEEHSLVLSVYHELRKKLRGIKLLPGRDEVNSFRAVKDEGEIALMRKAAAITDDGFSHLNGFIKPGMTEWNVAVEIEIFYRKNGCRKTAFDSIVASGKGSSMPHYETSMNRKIEKGDIVLIDMGCEYEGYNSDLTRTIFVDTIDPFFREIYGIVKTAQQEAVDKARPGITTGRLDGIARGIISEKGYGKNFGHSLGHGVGLEVHELPAVKAGDFRLKKNMVITIEPGIYVPDRGGIRIEDTVLLCSGGCETLTKSSKDLIII